MFNEVEINKIITGAAILNPTSWKLMEKLSFVRRSNVLHEQSILLLMN